MWVGKTLGKDVVVELLQNPFHVLGADSDLGLDLREAPCLRGKDASIVEPLSHRKHPSLCVEPVRDE